MLELKLCGIKLKSPIILASGILGTSVKLMNRVADNGAGAVTCKSIGPKRREGHPNPTVVAIDDKTINNAVGLPTPGYKNMDKEFKSWENIKAPLIASIYGGSIKDYVDIASYLQKYDPSMIELNISCPNKDDGMVFGMSVEKTKQLIKKVKYVSSIPIMPKLTPNCENVVDIAKAAEKAGADALCCFNTFGPETYKVDGIPVLSYGKGGISGPCIRKKSLELVKNVAAEVNIPIVGTGGITNGKDAVDMLKAGATAVGVGSAAYFRGIDVFDKINEEIKQFMDKNDIASLGELKNDA